MNKLRCAVVGVGYLGKFHAEKYASLPETELVAVCDAHAETVKEVAGKLQTKALTSYQQLLGLVDAVSIVTPTQHHHAIAKFFLENGVHVLVEKPITTTVAEADDLIRTAEKHKMVLQVGHLERFNSVLNAIEKYIDSPRFIESIRLAPFKLRGTDVNVVLDLMIHDIDIIQYIVGSKITSIQANGANILSNQIDIANARITFENTCVANVTASRVSVKQVRKLRLFQPHSYISLDMQHKKVAIHYKGKNEMFPGIPEIISEEHAFEYGDSLMEEIKAFVMSIREKKPVLVTGQDGKMALATAIQITDIVRQQMELQKESVT